MNFKEAYAFLKKADLLSEKGLEGQWDQITYVNHSPTAYLDGNFTADELEAISLYMRSVCD